MIEVMNETETSAQNTDHEVEIQPARSAGAASPKRIKNEGDKNISYAATAAPCNVNTGSLMDEMLCREVPFADKTCKEEDVISVQTLPTIVVDYDFICLLANRVYATLGPGFSEIVYQKALSHDLSEYHIEHDMEQIIPVMYKDTAIGAVRADIVVQKKMVIELKRVVRITSAHLQQAEMYARLLQVSEIIVINFPCQANTAVEVCVFGDDQTWNPMIRFTK